MKKCFTINHLRTSDDFLSYQKLIKDGYYQGVEIFYPYQLEIDSFIKYQENCYELRKMFPNLEMVLHLPHGPNNSLTVKETLENNLKMMENAILFANQFNVEKLTLHLGIVNKEIERNLYIENIISTLKYLCDFSKKYNMVLMIENMPSDSELGYSPFEILEIITKVNKDNLKFILDTGHAHVSKYELSDYVYTLKEYLYHMHFNDNSGLRDEHKRIGLGTIDFDKLFQALSVIKYNNLHCMEVIFKDGNDLLNFSDDLSKYDQYYSKCHK